MNVQKRRQTKQKKVQRKTQQKTRQKKKEDGMSILKSVATTLLIWGLVIVNLFLIASFVSKFWRAPGGNEMAITADGEQQTIEQPIQKVQVEVLNGCGVPGVAKIITQFLRDHGYDVVKTDNYDNFNIPETTVIDRRSLSKIRAIEVAKILGVSVEKGVAPFLNQDLLLDVSVIIGHDYNSLIPYKNRSAN